MNNIQFKGLWGKKKREKSEVPMSYIAVNNVGGKVA